MPATDCVVAIWVIAEERAVTLGVVGAATVKLTFRPVAARRRRPTASVGKLVMVTSAVATLRWVETALTKADCSPMVNCCAVMPPNVTLVAMTATGAVVKEREVSIGRKPFNTSACRRRT